MERRIPKLTCHQCMMTFNSISHLTTHRDKYCLYTSVSDSYQSQRGQHSNPLKEKIAQLNMIKEASIRRSHENDVLERLLVSEMRLKQQKTPEHLDGAGEMLPLTIVEKFLQNDARAVDWNKLREKYGSHIPVSDVQQMIDDMNLMRAKAPDPVAGVRRSVENDAQERLLPINVVEKLHDKETRDVDWNKLEEKYGPHIPISDVQKIIDKNLLKAKATDAKEIIGDNYNNQPNPSTYLKPHFSTQLLPYKYADGSVAEVSNLMQYYLRNGGYDAHVLKQLSEMIEHAEKPKSLPSQPVHPLSSSDLQNMISLKAENLYLKNYLMELNQSWQQNADVEHSAYKQRIEDLEKKFGQLQIMPPSKTIEKKPESYAQDFSIFYDFITGLQQMTRTCKIVMNLYDGVRELGTPFAFPNAKAELFKAGVVAMFGLRQPLNNCLSLPSVSLVIELLTSSEAEKMTTKGWLKLRLFSSEQKLRAGAWRIPFKELPLRPSLSDDDYDCLASLRSAVMFLRVVRNSDVQSASMEQITPANHLNYALL